MFEISIAAAVPLRYVTRPVSVSPTRTLALSSWSADAITMLELAGAPPLPAAALPLEPALPLPAAGTPASTLPPLPAAPGVEPAAPGVEPAAPGAEPAAPGAEPAAPGVDPAAPELLAAGSK
jgi:hypothetical protein